MTTSCCTRSTRRRNSAAARSSAAQRRLRVGRVGARPLVGAVAGALDEAELLDVARNRRLRRVEAALMQPAAQLLLAVERLAVDEFENHGLAACFHRDPDDSGYTIVTDVMHRFLLIQSRPDVYKYSFRCIQSTAAVAAAAPAAGASAPPRVAVAGATGYAGQELLRLLARHPAVDAHGGDVVGRRPRRARRLPALARLWDGAITPLVAGRARARGRRRVSGAARRGGRRARAGAGRRRRARHRSVGRVPAARRRRRARAGIRRRTACRTASPTASPSGSATPCAGARLVANPGCYPTAALLALAPLVDGRPPRPRRRHHRRREVRRLGRRQDAVRADALLRVPRQPVGVRRVQPPPRRRNRAGRRRAHGHVRAAPGAARSRHPRDDLRARGAGHDRGGARATSIERAYAGATFVRLVGAALPEIKHVAHTNFCDIGWRVDPSGRAILVSVIDNLLKGAVGPGRAEHERHARPRRADGAAVSGRGSGRPEVRRRAARGSARGWQRSSPRVAAIARAAAPARRRPRRRQGDRRRAEGGGHREAAGRRPAHHRRRDARRRRRGAGRARSTRGSWRRSTTAGVAGGRADGRRRRLRAVATRRRRTARSTAAPSISGASACRPSGADMRLLDDAASATASCRSSRASASAPTGGCST